MDRIVDAVAPSGPWDFIVKSFLLVAAFTVFDGWVSEATRSFTVENQLHQSLVTFLVGAPFGLFVMGIMASQRRLKDHLSHLASTDMLTGLPNRQAFILQASEHIDRAQNGVIFMIDVDHFKAINDTYGHAVGDACLLRVGEHLRQQIRSQDLVGRIGGEEFAVFLPEADRDEASHVAARICKPLSINAGSLLSDGMEDLSLTLSVGCVLAKPSLSLNDLLVSADTAMYSAKVKGRARVEWSHGAGMRPKQTAPALQFN